MGTYLNDLIQSLEREAEETREHLRTYPPARLTGRTMAEHNLKRIEQRLATLQELRLAERNPTKRPGRRRSSPAALTRMYGPAARCKRNVGSAGGAPVLHQCTRPRMWSVFRPLRPPWV